MATATKIDNPSPPVPVLRLDITQDEAEVLRTMLENTDSEEDDVARAISSLYDAVQQHTEWSMSSSATSSGLDVTRD